jgi:2-isopropylmalate synthase
MQAGELSLSTSQKGELASLLYSAMPHAIIEVSYAEGHFDARAVYDAIRAENPQMAPNLSAFGSTRKPHCSIERCSNTNKMLEAGTDIVTIFGKTWLEHVKGLGLRPDTYLDIISETVSHLRSHGKRVIYDLEHFFSGLADNPEYAKMCIDAAASSGAETIVMCNTKGGMLPHDIVGALDSLDAKFREHDVRWGFHGHNDTGCAVGNTHSFLDHMKSRGIERLQVQGTQQGFGERCGNANLTTLIGNLIDKRQEELDINSENWSAFAREVSSIAGVPIDPKAPYVGPLAFWHKGGIHIFSDARGMGYNHTNPAKWGNSGGGLLTSMAGKDFYARLAAGYGFPVDKGEAPIQDLHKKIKALEDKGYRIMNHKAEHLLLINETFGTFDINIDFERWNTQSTYYNMPQASLRESVTTLRQPADGLMRRAHVWSSSMKGPVDSQFKGIQEYLEQKYDYVNHVNLVDFNVGITRYSSRQGSESAVIAYISFRDTGPIWTTQGVSENILEATLEAIAKGFRYHILRHEVPKYRLD